LLVGEGSERSKSEELVYKLGLQDSVKFTGRVPFTQIPEYISIFDVAVVSARSADDFHYSPLKLREYLAAGIPTVAPRAGDISVLFQDNTHLLLYTVGDIQDTASKIVALIEDPMLLQKLHEEGKKIALANCTWDYEVRKVLALDAGKVLNVDHNKLRNF
jgi:glycosyltransferase involved in cell wall biosynthesis